MTAVGVFQVAITDEDIVRALVQEVVQVMNGPLFYSALRVCPRLPSRTIHCLQGLQVLLVRCCRLTLRMTRIRIICTEDTLDAVQASVEEVTKQVQKQLQEELEGSRLPLAKVVPRVSAVTDALLKPDGAIRQSMLQNIAQLPEVERLAASVYSFGPS